LDCEGAPDLIAGSGVALVVSVSVMDLESCLVSPPVAQRARHDGDRGMGEAVTADRPGQRIADAGVLSGAVVDRSKLVGGGVAVVGGGYVEIDGYVPVHAAALRCVSSWRHCGYWPQAWAGSS
jgi:hypothetical protein